MLSVNASTRGSVACVKRPPQALDMEEPSIAEEKQRDGRTADTRIGPRLIFS
jgi:hypothetical protein